MLMGSIRCLMLPAGRGWKMEEEGDLEASGPLSWGGQQRCGQVWSESRPRPIVSQRPDCLSWVQIPIGTAIAQSA